MNEVSKGMLLLRKNSKKPVSVTSDGEVFFFKKLTILAEEDIKNIVKSHQDPTLKAPKEPKPAAGEDELADTVLFDFNEKIEKYTDRAEKLFRQLTCELMKYILTDTDGEPLFSEDDDLYSNVDNVYATNFYKAYTHFRSGASGGVVEAEARFQG